MSLSAFLLLHAPFPPLHTPPGIPKCPPQDWWPGPGLSGLLHQDRPPLADQQQAVLAERLPHLEAGSGWGTLWEQRSSVHLKVSDSRCLMMSDLSCLQVQDSRQ